MRTQDGIHLLTHPAYAKPYISFCDLSFANGIAVHCRRHRPVSSNCLLVHDVCLQALEKISNLDIPPEVLFLFGQALSVDWMKNKSQNSGNNIVF